MPSSSSHSSQLSIHSSSECVEDSEDPRRSQSFVKVDETDANQDSRNDITQVPLDTDTELLSRFRDRKHIVLPIPPTIARIHPINLQTDDENNSEIKAKLPQNKTNGSPDIAASIKTKRFPNSRKDDEKHCLTALSPHLRNREHENFEPLEEISLEEGRGPVILIPEGLYSDDNKPAAQSFPNSTVENAYSQPLTSSGYETATEAQEGTPSHDISTERDENCGITHEDRGLSDNTASLAAAFAVPGIDGGLAANDSCLSPTRYSPPPTITAIPVEGIPTIHAIHIPENAIENHVVPVPPERTWRDAFKDKRVQIVIGFLVITIIAIAIPLSIPRPPPPTPSPISPPSPPSPPPPDVVFYQIFPGYQKHMNASQKQYFEETMESYTNLYGNATDNVATKCQVRDERVLTDFELHVEYGMSYHSLGVEKVENISTVYPKLFESWTGKNEDIIKADLINGGINVSNVHSARMVVEYSKEPIKSSPPDGPIVDIDNIDDIDDHFPPKSSIDNSTIFIISFAAVLLTACAHMCYVLVIKRCQEGQRKWILLDVFVVLIVIAGLLLSVWSQPNAHNTSFGPPQSTALMQSFRGWENHLDIMNERDIAFFEETMADYTPLYLEEILNTKCEVTNQRILKRDLVLDEKQSTTEIELQAEYIMTYTHTQNFTWLDDELALPVSFVTWVNDPMNKELVKADLTGGGINVVTINNANIIVEPPSEV